MASMDIIVETPRGSGNKYDYDAKKRLFRLHKVLPEGMVFPYDFGFIHGTRGEDGDPLDAVVVAEFTSFPGCVISCRIAGAITATQLNENHTRRISNDRYIAIPEQSVRYGDITEIEDVPEELLTQLENFFTGYNRGNGKEFRVGKRLGAGEAVSAAIRSGLQ